MPRCAEGIDFFVATAARSETALTRFFQIEARTNAGTLNENVGDAPTFSSDDLRKRLTTGTTLCKLVLHHKNRRHLRLVSVPKDANCIMWQDLNSDVDTHQVLLRDIRYNNLGSGLRTFSAAFVCSNTTFLSQIVCGFAETGRAITESGGSLDWARCLTLVSNDRAYEFEADSEEQAVLWVQVFFYKLCPSLIFPYYATDACAAVRMPQDETQPLVAHKMRSIFRVSLRRHVKPSLQ